jgi:hypothetical protein
MPHRDVVRTNILVDGAMMEPGMPSSTIDFNVLHLVVWSSIG